jgi:hypothetical protein
MDFHAAGFQRPGVRQLMLDEQIEIGLRVVAQEEKVGMA